MEARRSHSIGSTLVRQDLSSASPSRQSSIKSLPSLECRPQLLTALLHCCAPDGEDSGCCPAPDQGRRSLPERPTVRFSIADDPVGPAAAGRAAAGDLPQRSQSLPASACRGGFAGGHSRQGRVLPAMRASAKLLAALLEFRADSVEQQCYEPEASSSGQQGQQPERFQPPSAHSTSAACCTVAQVGLIQAPERPKSPSQGPPARSCTPPPASHKLSKEAGWRLSFQNQDRPMPYSQPMPCPDQAATVLPGPQTTLVAGSSWRTALADPRAAALQPAAPQAQGWDLRFRDRRLETGFKLYHNQVATPVDAAWGSFGIVLGVVVCVADLLQGRPAPLGEWWIYFVLPLFGMLLRGCVPRHYQQHREVLWLCHRFLMMLGTTLPGSYVFKDAATQRMLAYNMSATLVNAIGNKVRFHLEAAMCVALWALMLPCMALRTPQPTHARLGVHALFTVVLPVVLVYSWDRRQRQRFLAKAPGKAV